MNSPAGINEYPMLKCSGFGESLSIQAAPEAYAEFFPESRLPFGDWVLMANFILIVLGYGELHIPN